MMERKSIAQEIMTLRALALPELLAKYREVFGKEAACTSRERLWKEIIWKVQADRAGGVESAATKVGKLAGDVTFTIKKAKKAEAASVATRRRKPDEPPVGTVLARMWHGKEVRLQVVDGGYEVDGVLYKTLSAAAKGVTQSHWNGRLFWGLKNRRKRKP
jgi:hypothetical protein